VCMRFGRGLDVRNLLLSTRLFGAEPYNADIHRLGRILNEVCQRMDESLEFRLSANIRPRTQKLDPLEDSFRVRREFVRRFIIVGRLKAANIAVEVVCPLDQVFLSALVTAKSSSGAQVFQLRLK